MITCLDIENLLNLSELDFLDVTAVVTVLIAQFKDYFDAALHIFNSYFVYLLGISNLHRGNRLNYCGNQFSVCGLFSNSTFIFEYGKCRQCAADHHNIVTRCTTAMSTKTIPWRLLFNEFSISRHVLTVPVHKSNEHNI